MPQSSWLLRATRLTTTDYEDTDYPDIEEGVEAFKALVEEVKADVLAVLTGDDTGCLDPEDVDCDNEAEFTRRALLAVARDQREKAFDEAIRLMWSAESCPACGSDLNDQQPDCPVYEFQLMTVAALEALRTQEDSNEG